MSIPDDDGVVSFTILIPEVSWCSGTDDLPIKNDPIADKIDAPVAAMCQ